MQEHSKRLHELLEQLHRELESAEDLDADAEDDLRAAMQDIRGALAARAPEESGEEESADSRVDHGFLGDFARDFSASHPLIARTVGQLADILGQSGI
jgi:hypothetical protein